MMEYWISWGLMQKLIFKIRKDINRHVVVEATGPTIYLLSYCLTNLWLSHLHEHIDWALNPEEWFMSMNISELIKDKEDDIIHMCSELSEEPDGGPFYDISINEFVKLLPKWKELVEAKIPTITITDNNGILTIVGS